VVVRWVDADGNVVGISTMILTQSGGNEGWASPCRAAWWPMWSINSGKPQVVARRDWRRGTNDLAGPGARLAFAARLGGGDRRCGSDSTAARAGVQVGDVIEA